MCLREVLGGRRGRIHARAPWHHVPAGPSGVCGWRGGRGRSADPGQGAPREKQWRGPGEGVPSCYTHAISEEFFALGRYRLTCRGAGGGGHPVQSLGMGGHALPRPHGRGGKRSKPRQQRGSRRLQCGSDSVLFVCVRDEGGRRAGGLGRRRPVLAAASPRLAHCRSECVRGVFALCPHRPLSPPRAQAGQAGGPRKHCQRRGRVQRPLLALLPPPSSFLLIRVDLPSLHPTHA